MKKNIKVLTIALLAGAWVLNAILFNLFKPAFFTGTYSLKKFSNEYVAGADKFKTDEILIIGSSPALAAVNTTLVKSAVSIGDLKSSLYDIRDMLERILKDRKPKLIILGLSHHEHLIMNERIRDQRLARLLNAEEYWRYYQDFRQHSPRSLRLDFGSFPMHWLSVALYSPFEYLPLWFRFDSSFIELHRELEKSLGRHRGQFIAYDYFTRRVHNIMAYDFRRDVLESSVITPDYDPETYRFILHDILRLLSEKNIKTVIFLPPLPGETVNRVGPIPIERLEQLIKDVVADYPKVFQVNTPKVLGQPLFFDPIHVNWLGSLIFTNHLMEQIASVMGNLETTKGIEKFENLKDIGALLEIKRASSLDLTLPPSQEKFYCLIRQDEINKPCNSPLIISSSGRLYLISRSLQQIKVSDAKRANYTEILPQIGFRDIGSEEIIGTYEVFFPYSSKSPMVSYGKNGAYTFKKEGLEVKGTYEHQKKGIVCRKRADENGCFRVFIRDNDFIHLDEQGRIHAVMKKTQN